MTVKDEYEYLKTELMIKLADVTPACKLDCPFDFHFSKEEEDKFLPKGGQLRVAVKKAFIILDNTYKKVRLYPTDEFIEIFEETKKDIFEDLKAASKNISEEDKIFLYKCSTDEIEEYIKELVDRISKTLESFVLELKKLTPEDVEREIKIKDKVAKSTKNPIDIDDKDPKGLF